jgi:hypothetical protein
VKKALVLVIALIANISFAGTEISGGGGNGAVAEFKYIGIRALSVLANRSDTQQLTKDFNAASALSVFKKTDVQITKKDLKLNGVDVAAINYPTPNQIIFEIASWDKLSDVSKIQLVIHEIIGLTHRNVLDDSNYEASRTLTLLVLRTGVENVALALATANYYRADQPRVQTERTRVLPVVKDAYGEPLETTEVYVQTFENSSNESVRIYHVIQDITGAVIKAELVGSEGPVGA